MSQPEHFPKDSHRREFIAGAAATLAFASHGALAQSPSVDHIPIIDAHIHLFDNMRPLGAGYMLSLIHIFWSSFSSRSNA